jgi:hypothetical protein
MRRVVRSHKVRVFGPFLLAAALSGCGDARDAAQDILDGLKDAGFGLIDAGWHFDDEDAGGGAWDSGSTPGLDGGSDAGVSGGDAASDDDGAVTQDGASEAGSSDSCGDGVLQITERCDTAIAAGSPGACPSSCTPSASGACERSTLVGSGCQAFCEDSTIVSCTNGDGCCANGCTLNNDDDCQASCGNGVIEGSEICDGNCPGSCDDQNACTADSASGQVSSCDRVCQHTDITVCQNGDGCCAPGCNSGNDNDCSASCGDHVVNSGEKCDGNCPSSCADADACTADVLSGSAQQCTAQCTHTAISACANGDGCCPSGCKGNNDNDCPSVCGNHVVEPGEECEPASSNDANCTSTCLLPATQCLNEAVARGESRTDSCVTCGCNGCASQLAACYGATDLASAGPAAGTSRGVLCAAVVTCARDSGCSGDTCYCGTKSGIACLSGANGPCKTQIERAAESTSALTIQSRKSDTNYALGRSNAVSDCSVAKCKTQCGL